jgi:hypothetical protein
MRFGTWFARLASAVVVVGLAACGESPVETAVDPDFDAAPGATAKASGFGVFNAGVPVDFGFAVVQLNGFDAAGHFRIRTDIGGLIVDFAGRATCMAVDPVNRRGWIGGVVTRNKSTHPSFTTPIHQVGRDVWFRFVDYGNGGAQPDRSSFFGFEGAAGIITSEEYCQARIWPGPPTDVVDARTNPLTEGNLRVITF